jgi:Flp pilus assembly pilin Flp
LFRYITLESGLVVGAGFIAVGLIASFAALQTWGSRSFGNLQPTVTLRTVIPAVTMLMLGCQMVLSSFFLSILGLRRR